MGRLVRVAIWALAAAATVSLVALSYGLARPVPSPEAITIEPPMRETNAWARWAVTGQLSAHHVLIAQVETRHLDEARSIARELAEPLKERYAEILVYFHRPGRPDTLPPRRVQWTRKAGYVETIYDERNRPD